MPLPISGPMLLPLLLLLGVVPRGREGGTRPLTVHDFHVRGMDGHDVPLLGYAGKVLLMVNTASRCGFTPQYEGLETLAQRYRERGFEVLAFPADDFLHQEPGTDAEIREFCSGRFGITFPLFSKLHVKGGEMHPLFEHLTRDSAHPGAVRWNFAKFLVDRHGRVIARFDPRTSPTHESVTRAIEAALDSP